MFQVCRLHRNAKIVAQRSCSIGIVECIKNGRPILCCDNDHAFAHVLHAATNVTRVNSNQRGAIMSHRLCQMAQIAFEDSKSHGNGIATAFITNRIYIIQSSVEDHVPLSHSARMHTHTQSHAQWTIPLLFLTYSNLFVTISVAAPWPLSWVFVSFENHHHHNIYSVLYWLVLFMHSLMVVSVCVCVCRVDRHHHTIPCV